MGVFFNLPQGKPGYQVLTSKQAAAAVIDAVREEMGMLRAFETYDPADEAPGFTQENIESHKRRTVDALFYASGKYEELENAAADEVTPITLCEPLRLALRAVLQCAETSGQVIL